MIKSLIGFVSIYLPLLANEIIPITIPKIKDKIKIANNILMPITQLIATNLLKKSFPSISSLALYALFNPQIVIKTNKKQFRYFSHIFSYCKPESIVKADKMKNANT